MNTNDFALKAMNVVKKNVRSFSMIGVIIIIWTIFTIGNPQFLSPQGMSNLFRQMTITAFLAIGMTLVIVTGNIDLSAGSVMGFINAIAAVMQVRTMRTYLPMIFPGITPGELAIVSTMLTIFFCLAVGTAIGVLQGSLIAYAGIPSFIVTLGGQLIFRGGVLGVTEGKMWTPIEAPLDYIGNKYQSPEVGIVLAIIITALLFFFAFWSRKQKKKYGFELKPLYVDLLKAAFFTVLVWVYVIYVANSYKIQGVVQGLQNPVLVLAVFVIILSYVSTNTRFGRYCYAIGGHNIKKNVFSVFVLMGFLCGVAGIVLTGYQGGANIQSGQNYELYAIAACVIGGTSLMGGEGTVFGAIIGAVTMESLGTGMTILNVSAYLTYLAKGAMLVIAVWIDVLSKKLKM
jgi:D-xylose transport system permease protein